MVQSRNSRDFLISANKSSWGKTHTVQTALQPIHSCSAGGTDRILPAPIFLAGVRVPHPKHLAQILRASGRTGPCSPLASSELYSQQLPPSLYLDLSLP